ncbi:MAG: DNA-processing protein DprA [Gemmatimonadales bacterium]
MTDLAYVTLALVPGIGPARLAALCETFRSAQRVFDTPLEALQQVPGISKAAASAIRNADLAKTEKLLERMRALGGTVLTPADPRFPPALRVIPDRPMLLFASGRLELLQQPAVAVVGSRDHSRYGTAVCRQFASGIASAGLVVASGMARGIDAIAHTAALDAGGASVGVLGNGLGVVYPSANKRLYDRMAEQGCLLTEFPPGERPNAGSFPRRNRLISGLARVTLVIEAGATSGALITVDAALQQGRDVFAVPGPITQPTSLGCNKLIQSGASPALTVNDVLERYDRHMGPDAVPSATTLSAREQQVVAYLGDAERHVDAITERLATTPGDALAILTALELRGVVTQEPGKWFRLSRSL